MRRGRTPHEGEGLFPTQSQRHLQQASRDYSQARSRHHRARHALLVVPARSSGHCASEATGRARLYAGRCLRTGRANSCDAVQGRPNQSMRYRALTTGRHVMKWHGMSRTGRVPQHDYEPEPSR